ncbi:MAG: DNA-directed RNA polymerase subunit A' [Candidatus Bathyarchaeia archaeon]|jgi:DNA-directed RNA polymerase subunit A'|nr:DNA-directed RNA polymerase subunit A' [Candidatus Bathyarchaeota archaeon]
MSTNEESYKMVDGIKFSLLSPNEIRKLSTVEIQTADTYDEDGVPIVSGLMDGRLGTLEPRQKCRTCGNTAVACPGHFGHIELAEPVIHVSFIKLIHRLLAVTCRNCGRILLSDEKIKEYEEKIKEVKTRLNTVPDSLYKKILKHAKKTMECPHCGTQQYPIELVKPTSFHEATEEGAPKIPPSAIRERLERIPDDDLRILGIDPKVARTEWMILQVLPVPPVTVRPSITLESGIRSEDDLTHKLVDIIRINQKLGEALESGVPINIIQELHDLLQYHVTTYFDNEVSGLPPARHRSGRALKTICQRLKGKEGRFRGNLSGKRVDFSARTVISPDLNLDINEVGVPIALASRLTVPEKVTEWNLEKMKQLIRNGPEQYPGALYIVRTDGRRIRLEFVPERESIAESLQPAFVVERHIKDGDIVLFNRQPSLHRMSIMAHSVKVLPFKTFRLNPCVCPPYNADFDGDEMNLHVPQGEEARTEASLLMRVQDQILSPRYGGPIIGAIRDLLTSSFLLTAKKTFLTKEKAGRLLAAAGYVGDLPPPDVKGPNPLWSGKSIFSIFIPEGLNFTSKSNLCSVYKCRDCRKEKCQHDSYIVIKDGNLKQGVIDKNSIGAEKSESLFHRIVKDYGSTVGKDFLNSITRLLDRYMTLRGFTYAFDELAISDEVHQKIKKATEKAEERVNVLIESYKKGNLDRLAGQTIEESLEIYIMNELSTVRDLAGQYADSYFPEDNEGIIMARAGARGSMLNIGQMTACLGQQSIRGKRILRGYRNRTLPFFEANDAGAEARGFVYASYRDGLNPTEFFFHAVGGREGLVDTAVRTQQSGYMQRRLINALEHIRVEYDGTVRDSTGNIIQFTYGEDGVDTTKSDHGKAVNIERLVDSVRLFSAKGAIAGKRYIESKIDSISNKLPQSLVDELRRNLQGAKLTRKNVDQAISLTLDSYVRALIEPGEAAGIVSAQSIGEPGTQMTLRTFHFAGVKEQNVTLGLPRLIEIVDARKIPSTPTMTIYLEKKYRNREKAEQVANAVTHTILEDIADSIVSDIAKMKVMAKLNPNTMKDRGITLQEVREALKPPNSQVKIDRYDVEVTPKEMEIPQFKRFTARLRQFKLKGAPSVRKALVLEDQGEWIIRTEGSGLDVALNQPGVDKTRTISNNVHEVAEVLGIEAARNVLIKEAMSVLDEQGLDVDIRHVMLVADMMTNSGVVLQVGRHGISGEKSSTLAKAAFEITIPTIVDAAVKGTTDMLKGVAENVIVGRQVPMGTGLIDVYMSMPEKEKK